MPSVTIFLELLLLLIGVIFCVKALLSIKLLVLELPEGALKKRWNILRNLMFFFILSYGLVGIAFWLLSEELNAFLALGVSFILALGGLFAYFVGQLALQTINDVRDLALLQHESITDGLTGLRNRRYFDQRIHEEVMLSLRYKMPLTLILLDVDHFKKINDTYGHKIGDEVLVNLSKLIQTLVRDSDFVARYGGEEVAIITPNTPKEEAEKLAQRLREMIEQTTMAMIPETKEVIQVTASMGICSLSAVIKDQGALIEEADGALYLAKKYGRNRVVLSNW